MKKLIIHIFLIILCCMIGFYSSAQHSVAKRDSISVRVVDNRGESLFGVSVVNKTYSYIITSSNIDGEVTLFMTDDLYADSIQFYCYGYESLTFKMSDIKIGQNIELKPLQVYLDETIVSPVDKNSILKKAMSFIKRERSLIRPSCNYYSHSGYDKITYCHNRCVEYRRELGLRFSSGNVGLKNDWDENYRSYFIPKYAAYSYNITSDGKDTIAPVWMSDNEIRFDMGTRKIFTVMRVVELFGPLFDGLKNFNFRLIDIGETYDFDFETKSSFYPNKCRIAVRGKLSIDVESGRLLRMEFTTLDYPTFRQPLLSKERHGNAPFVTSAIITFAYNNNCYFSSCKLTTEWKRNLGEDFIMIEQPSRENPALISLVEYEAFTASDYIRIDSPIKDDIMLSRMHMSHRYPIGEYNEDVFEKNISILDVSQQAIDLLSGYCPIVKQFQRNSFKPYYSDNYTSKIQSTTTSNVIYLKSLKDARTFVFGKFPY